MQGKYDKPGRLGLEGGVIFNVSVSIVIDVRILEGLATLLMFPSSKSLGGGDLGGGRDLHILRVLGEGAGGSENSMRITGSPSLP